MLMLRQLWIHSQPARLDNLTTGHDMVGTKKVYCVLSASALDVLRGAAIEWSRVQGSVDQIEILLKISSNNKNSLTSNTVLMTTILTRES